MKYAKDIAVRLVRLVNHTLPVIDRPRPPGAREHLCVQTQSVATAEMFRRIMGDIFDGAAFRRMTDAQVVKLVELLTAFFQEVALERFTAAEVVARGAIEMIRGQVWELDGRVILISGVLLFLDRRTPYARRLRRCFCGKFTLTFNGRIRKFCSTTHGNTDRSRRLRTRRHVDGVVRAVGGLAPKGGGDACSSAAN